MTTRQEAQYLCCGKRSEKAATPFSFALAMRQTVSKVRTDVALMYNVYDCVRGRAAGRPCICTTYTVSTTLVRASRCMLFTPHR